MFCFLENNEGLYPLIGWKIGEEVVYLTEGSISDVGTAIKWALDIGTFCHFIEGEIHNCLSCFMGS